MHPLGHVAASGSAAARGTKERAAPCTTQMTVTLPEKNIFKTMMFRDVMTVLNERKYGRQADLPLCQTIWPVISSFIITSETDNIVVGVVRHSTPAPVPEHLILKQENKILLEYSTTWEFPCNPLAKHLKMVIRSVPDSFCLMLG